MKRFKYHSADRVPHSGIQNDPYHGVENDPYHGVEDDPYHGMTKIAVPNSRSSITEAG